MLLYEDERARERETERKREDSDVPAVTCWPYVCSIVLYITVVCEAMGIIAACKKKSTPSATRTAAGKIKKRWAKAGGAPTASAVKRKKKVNHLFARVVRQPAATASGCNSPATCKVVGTTTTTTTVSRVTTTTITTTTTGGRTAPVKKPIGGKKAENKEAPSLAVCKVKKKRAERKTVAKASKQQPHVYVLQLEGGYVYVGKTKRSVQTRLREHMMGGTAPKRRLLALGAAFTRLHKPTGKLLPRLSNLEGDGDGPERDETLRQMYKRGPQSVRGWKYVRAGPLRQAELEDIESNIRELFDLCRRCGKAGHFVSQCREKKDRNGKPLSATCCIASSF